MTKEFSIDEAMQIGDEIGVDWNKISVDEFRMGMKVELEHGTKLGEKTNVTNDDFTMTGRITLAHLLELPDYYTRLDKMEKEGDAYWEGK